MDKEKQAHIRNKLQATKSTLEQILEKKQPPEEFIKLALKDLDEAINLMQKIT